MQRESCLPFYILAANKDFTDVYEFINIENPTKAMLEELKLKHLPQVLVMNPTEDGQAQIMHIQGELSYSSIWQFTYDVNKYNIDY